MSDLFTQYEERPPCCGAVPVWHDNVDRIAAYYSQSGYETDVKRDRVGVTLSIYREDTEREPGCELVVELPYSQLNGSERARRKMLVYGHPPTLQDYDEFWRRWREVKEPPLG